MNIEISLYNIFSLMGKNIKKNKVIKNGNKSI